MIQIREVVMQQGDRLHDIVFFLEIHLSYGNSRKKLMFQDHQQKLNIEP